MSEVPSSWFETLQVDPDDVARVGYSLAQYAAEYEAETLSASLSAEEQIERRLLVASTLEDSATLLVLIDRAAAQRLLAQSATLFEQAEAPDAWTVGLACQGAWNPTRHRDRRQDLPMPNDGIASLAELFYHQERERGREHVSWQLAAGYRDNPGRGWTSAGVPARLLNRFVDLAFEGDVGGAVDLLDQITRRADETIRVVQRDDAWHWRRFLADVPLVNPELLALAGVAARVDDRVTDAVREGSPSPARVALLAGMRLGEDPPRIGVPA